MVDWELMNKRIVVSRKVCPDQSTSREQSSILWASTRKGYLHLRMGEDRKLGTIFHKCQQQFQDVGGISGVVFPPKGLASLVCQSRAG